MKVLLVGSGDHAFQYALVLSALDVDFDIVSKSNRNEERFYNVFSKKVLILSGGERSQIYCLYSHIILAVSIDSLVSEAFSCSQAGVENVLIEKPGALYVSDLQKICDSISPSCRYYIAYNRRYYSSVIKLLNCISLDGGISSIHFNFTEWEKSILDWQVHSSVRQRLVLSNSSHVIDLAFFIAGYPKEFSHYCSGSLKWHTDSACFVGAGVTKNNTPFSYHADWSSSGRWGVTVMTSKSKYLLSPLEKLQISPKYSNEYTFLGLDDDDDENYKPGLFKQVNSWLFRTSDIVLPSVSNHIDNMKVFCKIANYTP